MPVDHLTIRLGQNRHGEAELANAFTNPIDCLVVLARISIVRLQPCDRPILDVKRLGCGQH
jgi:hypothetical protein